MLSANTGSGSKNADPLNLNDPKRRKLIFGGLLCIGIAALAFGVVSFFNSLRSPFASTSATNNINFSLALENGSSLEGLRLKDTDGDGLSDYDELYLYQTSPYLADSDSDAASDRDEIDKNSDPNCPEGQTCRQPSFANSNTAINTEPSGVSLDLLRESLKKSGAPENIIDSLTDAELLDLYNQVAGEEGGTLTTNTDTEVNANTSTTAPTLGQLQNLTPDEIRSFLIQAGVDESLLNSVDDATLKAIFKQALNEQS